MTNLRSRRIYIAGPYSDGDPLDNVQVAIATADTLAMLGLDVHVPHLSHFWHEYFPHDWSFWMELCLAALDRCDALLRLPGDSYGADIEVRHARGRGLPVFFMPDDLEELLTWAKE
jgi:hypothetical protein